mmetsp:Transcript_67273/g.154129  ORF Transcript_67273/g.154129 Transcript_67273/m.154129 type:complete len:159 (-) Transcript_67273:94-570(-)
MMKNINTFISVKCDWRAQRTVQSSNTELQCGKSTQRINAWLLKPMLFSQARCQISSTSSYGSELFTKSWPSRFVFPFFQLNFFCNSQFWSWFPSRQCFLFLAHNPYGCHFPFSFIRNAALNWLGLWRWRYLLCRRSMLRLRFGRWPTFASLGSSIVCC